MSHTVIIILIVLSMTTLCFYVLRRESKRIYASLDEYKKSALNAKSKDELKAIRTDLVKWANGNCWHHEYHSHARTILAFIDGRLAS